MLPIQLPGTPEFSRCDERTLRSDAENAPDPMQRSDASLAASVERAIWNDEVLRGIEYHEIDVRAKDGIVYLHGHIMNTSSRLRTINAIRSVPGILGLRNHLILDENLLREVSKVLGILEHIHGCKFFMGSSHGVISINGIVNNEDVKLLAEIHVARNPNVRAVINHVRIAGRTGSQLQDLPFLQPILGEAIYFLDGPTGIVERVIINPNNRRVIAMLLSVKFTGPGLPVGSTGGGKPPLPVQLVHVPIDTVRYLTKASGFLLINSDEQSRYQVFDPAMFSVPAPDWTAPYPYCSQDVLFPLEYRKMEVQASVDTQRFLPMEELLADTSSRH